MHFYIKYVIESNDILHFQTSKSKKMIFLHIGEQNNASENSISENCPNSKIKKKTLFEFQR